MISQYIYKRLAEARYKILEDGTYFGEIPRLKGVWASGKTLEICQRELQEVLEDWLVLKIKGGDKISGFSTRSPIKIKSFIPQYA